MTYSFANLRASTLAFAGSLFFTVVLIAASAPTVVVA